MQSDKRWLLHYPNQIPHELTIPNETLQSYLFSSAEQHLSIQPFIFRKKHHLPAVTRRCTEISQSLD